LLCVNNCKCKFCFLQTDGDEDEDEEDDEDWINEDPTALEDYSTPLDADDCTIDEYIIFKEVLAGTVASTHLII